LQPAQVTVDAWVKASATGTYAYLLSKGANANAAASYALYTGSSGGLFFYIYNGTATAISPDAGTAIWDNNWHHVAGTFDGTAVRLFVDGVQVGGGTPTSIAIGYNLPTGN